MTIGALKLSVGSAVVLMIALGKLVAVVVVAEIASSIWPLLSLWSLLLLIVRSEVESLRSSDIIVISERSQRSSIRIEQSRS